MMWSRDIQVDKDKQKTEAVSGKPGNTGIQRILKASIYSLQGLKAALKHEAAVRQELALLIVSVLLLCWLDVSQIERVVMLGTVVLVLIVELINCIACGLALTNIRLC